jgi:hypothetical protein
MSEHRTEVGNWQAIWLNDRHCIRILLVRNLFEKVPLTSETVSAAAPDLAQMREKFPKLSRLWDAIRHEYWPEVIPPQKPSHAMSTKGNR